MAKKQTTKQTPTQGVEHTEALSPISTLVRECERNTLLAAALEGELKKRGIIAAPPTALNAMRDSGAVLEEELTLLAGEKKVEDFKKTLLKALNAVANIRASKSAIVQ